MWVAIFVVGLVIIFLPLLAGVFASTYVTTTWWIGLLVFVAIAVVTAPLAFGLFSGYTTAMIGWADEELMNEGRDDHARFWSGVPECECEEGYQMILGAERYAERHLVRTGTIEPTKITLSPTNPSWARDYEAYETYQCPETGVDWYMTNDPKYDRLTLIAVEHARGHGSIDS